MIKALKRLIKRLSWAKRLDNALTVNKVVVSKIRFMVPGAIPRHLKRAQRKQKRLENLKEGYTAFLPTHRMMGQGCLIPNWPPVPAAVIARIRGERYE